MVSRYRLTFNGMYTAKPNFPTVTHPTPGMPQKTAGFRGQCRFVVLKITALSEDIWH